MSYRFHPNVPGLHEAIMELVDAIGAETIACRTAPDNEAGDAITGAATARKFAAYDALLAFPRAAIEADMDDTGDDAYTCALALYRQHFLVMDGDYMRQDRAEECLFIDMVLRDCEPFASVPLSWAIDGQDRDERPSDDELQAGWDK